jgi:hypothetical protein
MKKHALKARIHESANQQIQNCKGTRQIPICIGSAPAGDYVDYDIMSLIKMKSTETRRVRQTLT